jgi:hypothetical protein
MPHHNMILIYVFTATPEKTENQLSNWPYFRLIIGLIVLETTCRFGMALIASVTASVASLLPEAHEKLIMKRGVTWATA